MASEADVLQASGERRDLRRATEIVGKKWHPVVISTLLADGRRGFNDLKGALDGISDKVLSDCLDDLQSVGLVTREVIDDKPVRVEYSLTTAGEDLESVIEDLRAWSREHLSEDLPDRS
ncbi:winged helix-turn-helix transcriptional regulator [Halomicroarcula sp. GCM10025324]|uniref:winged helix-turn-helix transcriptional regulator n=1 Tax=Haloarcula TaxID=2237 RepID=UPI0023E7A758|nr:helix-turn-helix domain-containing protein [Halomicroarcula sp. ZS-22-S1]